MSSPSADGNGPGGAYRGGNGWGPGALWDSVRYLVAFTVGRVQRRRLARRLQADRRELETKREETVRELGKVGLYMEGVDHPVVTAYLSRRDDLESRRTELTREIERHRRETESERELTAARIADLRKILDEARRHRKILQDKFDALVEERQSWETKVARAELEVGFNDKAVAQGEADLDLLAARDAPVQEIRKARVRLKKARVALDRARADLPKFRRNIERLDGVLVGVERELSDARRAEQRARDDLDRVIEDRDARAWERHKRERRLEDRLDQAERDFTELFHRAGKDIFANRVDHPGFRGWYERIQSLDRSMEQTDLALMSLDSTKEALDWRPLFRIFVWLVGSVLLIFLLLRVGALLSQ